MARLQPSVTSAGPQDLELLAAWREGDPTAGNQLMERYYASVLRFFALKVPASAEDLAQRTFLGCVEGLERLREDASFKAFLFAVARRQLLWHLRDKTRDDGHRGGQPSVFERGRRGKRHVDRAVDPLGLVPRQIVRAHVGGDADDLAPGALAGEPQAPADRAFARPELSRRRRRDDDHRRG